MFGERERIQKNGYETPVGCTQRVRQNNHSTGPVFDIVQMGRRLHGSRKAKSSVVSIILYLVKAIILRIYKILNPLSKHTTDFHLFRQPFLLWEKWNKWKISEKKRQVSHGLPLSFMCRAKHLPVRFLI